MEKIILFGAGKWLDENYSILSEKYNAIRILDSCDV